MIDAALLIVGIAILILGSRLSIDRAIGIAQHYHLSDFFVGVVILAIGSDLPEIVISVDAAVHQFRDTDTSGLILGNIIGSNFGQIGLIMGISGLIGYLTLRKQYIYVHGGLLLGAILYLYVAALDYHISRIEGGVLIVAFIVYLVMIFGAEEGQEEPRAKKGEHAYLDWFFLAMGLVLVVGGAELTVRSTVSLAEALGISQSLIAIIVLGIGSSLPELVISINAAMKAKGGMSVGNLVGSNILDTLLPVGLAGIIHPLTVEPGIVLFDLPVLFVFTLLVLVFFRYRRGLQRWEAMILLFLYGVYIAMKLLGY